MIRSIFKKSPIFILNLIVLHFAKLIKFSLMLGSTAMFFSMSNIAVPMVGIVGGLVYYVNFFAIQFLYKFLIGSGSIGIGYYIPQFFASAYWLSPSKYLRLVVPLLCMGLFVLHPVGGQAWVYSTFWLIPMIISFVGFNNTFLRALGSTFVAHAVGSVIWIYTVPMIATQWISLIPVVIAERLLFASGMVAVYYAVNFVRSLSNQKILLSKKLV
ncbi:MAG: hypothetical protein P4L22_00780 [Candidatus Babeliales bacterium]|nr:hypothetical protein [Candidatus Babeliales bacterium]